MELDTAMQTLIPNLHTSTKKMIRDILQTVMDQTIIKFCFRSMVLDKRNRRKPYMKNKLKKNLKKI